MTDARRPPPINVSALQEANYVNGPGRRFVLWVQGCHLGCAGCWNKHTWPFAPKALMAADEVFAKVAAAPGLDGVTFTGGEPFLQPRALAYLAWRVKAELGLTVQIFTGFDLAELKGRAQRELLSFADVVVAGRYNPALPNNGQKVHQFSQEKWLFNNTDVEVEISADGGRVVVTGYPDDALLADLRQIAESNNFYDRIARSRRRKTVMKEYIVEVVVDKDGELRAETKGMQGKVCVAELDKVLAGVEGERRAKNTDDFYKKSTVQTVKAGI